MGGNSSSSQLTYDDDGDRSSVSFVKGIRLSDKVVNRMKESPKSSPPQCQANGNVSSLPPKSAVSMLTKAPAPTLEGPILTQSQPLISSLATHLPQENIQTAGSPPLSLPAPSSPSENPASTHVIPPLVQPTKLITPPHIRFHSTPSPSFEPEILPLSVEPVTVESVAPTGPSHPKIEEVVAPTRALEPEEVPSPDAFVLPVIPSPAVESLAPTVTSDPKIDEAVPPFAMEAVPSPDPVVLHVIPSPAVGSLSAPDPSHTEKDGVVPPAVLEFVAPSVALEPVKVPSPDLVVLDRIPCSVVETSDSPEPSPLKVIIFPTPSLEPATKALHVEPADLDSADRIISDMLPSLSVESLDSPEPSPQKKEIGVPFSTQKPVSSTLLLGLVELPTSDPPTVECPPPVKPIVLLVQSAQDVELTVPSNFEAAIDPVTSIQPAVLVPPILEPAPHLPVDEEALKREIKEDLQQYLEHELSLKRQELHLQLEEVKVQAQVQANSAIQTQIEQEVRQTLDAEQRAYREAVKLSIMKERITTEDKMLMAQLYWMELKTHKLDEKEKELKKQSTCYTEHIAKLEKTSGQFLKVTAENFQKGKEEAHNRFKHVQIKPLCHDLQSQILRCYREYPGQTLCCSGIASAYMQCVDSAKQFSLQHRNSQK